MAIMLPWFSKLIEEDRALLGDDWWPYGVQRRRSSAALIGCITRWANEKLVNFACLRLCSTERLEGRRLKSLKGLKERKCKLKHRHFSVRCNTCQKMNAAPWGAERRETCAAEFRKAGIHLVVHKLKAWDSQASFKSDCLIGCRHSYTGDCHSRGDPRRSRAPRPSRVYH